MINKKTQKQLSEMLSHEIQNISKNIFSVDTLINNINTK